jgi:hypothetical protein
MGWWPWPRRISGALDAPAPGPHDGTDRPHRASPSHRHGSPGTKRAEATPKTRHRDNRPPRRSRAPQGGPHSGTDRRPCGPPCAGGAPQGDPPCGGHAPHGGPLGEAARLRLAEQSLIALAKAWPKAAKTYPADACRRTSVEELAVEFCRAVYAHPALIGMAISSAEVRKHYPLLCRAFDLTWPPPYKDFAKELALLLPRKRFDRRPREGERITCTRYVIKHLRLRWPSLKRNASEVPFPRARPRRHRPRGAMMSRPQTLPAHDPAAGSAQNPHRPARQGADGARGDHGSLHGICNPNAARAEALKSSLRRENARTISIRPSRAQGDLWSASRATCTASRARISAMGVAMPLGRGIDPDASCARAREPDLRVSWRQRVATSQEEAATMAIFCARCGRNLALVGGVHRCIPRVDAQSRRRQRG